jgi:large subunit ribosomal protein L32e
MTPSGHKAFLVSNVKDVELLLMHNRTYAAEYVETFLLPLVYFRTAVSRTCKDKLLRWESVRVICADKVNRIAHNVSSRKRIDIIARAKQLGVKVTNAKAKVTTEV